MESTAAGQAADAPAPAPADPAAHAYLGAPTAALAGATALAPGTRVTLPLLLRPAVMFPGEAVPLKLLRPEAALLRPLLSAGTLPLVGTVFGHLGRDDAEGGSLNDTGGVHLHCRVGVTLEVKSVHTVANHNGSGSVNVIAYARQRFALPPDRAVRVVGGVAFADVVVLGDGCPAGGRPSYRSGGGGGCDGLHVHPSLWRLHDVDALCRRAYDDARGAGLVSDEVHARGQAALARRWAGADVEGGALSPPAPSIPAAATAGSAAASTVAAAEPAAADGAAAAPTATDDVPPPLRHAWQAVAGPDPAAFADWLARSLPARSTDKADALAAPHVATRLRAFRRLLHSAAAHYCCVNCGGRVVARRDMLPLAGAGGGVSGVYVNPHGMVFRVQTASAVVPGSCMSDRDEPPSHEASWFPGYAWTIVQCSGCDALLGWRFDYMPRECAALRPYTVRFASRAELALLDDAHRAAVGLPPQGAAGGSDDPLRPRMFAVPRAAAAAAAGGESVSSSGVSSGDDEEDIDGSDDDGFVDEEDEEAEEEAAAAVGGDGIEGDDGGTGDGGSNETGDADGEQLPPPFGLPATTIAAFLEQLDDDLVLPPGAAAALGAAADTAVGAGDGGGAAGPQRVITAAGVLVDADVPTFLQRALNTLLVTGNVDTNGGGGGRPTVAAFQDFLREIEGEPMTAAVVRRLLPAGSRPLEAVVGPPPPGMPSVFYGFADGALELRVDGGEGAGAAGGDAAADDDAADDSGSGGTQQ